MAEVQARQSFPEYYRIEPRHFLVGSVRSGQAGARCALSYCLNNDPHLIRGIRISNTYDLPRNTSDAPPTADQMEYWRLCREIDDDQTLTLSIGQNNIVVNDVHQRNVCGRKGELWHAFATPYVAKGGNTISLDLVRITGYPAIIGITPIEPQVHATLWVERLVAGFDVQHEGPPRGIGRG